MTDEDIRELERAAEQAAPEVVQWVRALVQHGRMPEPPPPPAPPLEAGVRAWHRQTGAEYVLMACSRAHTITTEDSRMAWVEAWACQQAGKDRPVMVPAPLLTTVAPAFRATPRRGWWPFGGS